jgi:hypothetical protein
MKLRRKNRVLAPALAAALLLSACGRSPAPSAAKVIETRQADNLKVSLVNEAGELKQGQNQFVLWFQSADGKDFADAGKVTMSSSMAMPGMAPMTAPIELSPAGEKGKYTVKGEFAMSGAWMFEVRWDGPAGQGSTSFSANIR